MADLPQTPELIAVIRSSKRTLVVVKMPNPEPIQPIVVRVMAELEDATK